MKVEISKEQRDALGKKIELCVDFLRKEVQPHIVRNDKIEVAMSSTMDLLLTDSRIYVTESVPIVPGLDFCRKKVWLLENPGRKKDKQYICEANPDLAVEFLKCWKAAKAELEKQISTKNKQVDELNQFVEEFHL